MAETVIAPSRFARSIHETGSSIEPVTLGEKPAPQMVRPTFAPVEGFNLLEYDVQENETEIVLVFNPATYRQELEALNSFVVTGAELTSVPVFLLIKTRSRLIGVGLGLAAVGVISLTVLPAPLSLVAVLAVLGPLSVVSYGLKSQS